MEIISTKFKHCHLVEVSGRIDSATSPQLENELKHITDAGEYHIVIDLKNVEFLSSAALRVFINYQKLCHRFNRGEIVLADIQENVFKALDLAGFTKLFQIFDDAVTAVGNF